MGSALDLPPEVLHRVFALLPRDSMDGLRSVCSSFLRVVSSYELELYAQPPLNSFFVVLSTTEEECEIRVFFGRELAALKVYKKDTRSKLVLRRKYCRSFRLRFNQKLEVLTFLF